MFQIQSVSKVENVGEFWDFDYETAYETELKIDVIGLLGLTITTLTVRVSQKHYL